MLVRFLNLAIVIAVGSLAVTHLLQSLALCRTTLSAVHALLGALLQVSPAPFWWTLEIQTREEFLHISVWYQGCSQKPYGQHSPWCMVVWDRKGGGECATSASENGTIHEFHFSFFFRWKPTKLNDSQYSRHFWGPQRIYAKVLPLAQNCNKFSDFFSSAWALLFMPLPLPGCS